MAIRRGTTPDLHYTLPFDTSSIAVMYVSFSQNGNVVVEKSKEDCELNQNNIKLTLSQQDTLKFTEKYKLDMQLRIKTTDDKALASKTITTKVEDVLKDGEI